MRSCEDHSSQLFLQFPAQVSKPKDLVLEQVRNFERSWAEEAQVVVEKIVCGGDTQVLAVDRSPNFRLAPQG